MAKTKRTSRKRHSKSKRASKRASKKRASHRRSELAQMKAIRRWIVAIDHDLARLTTLRRGLRSKAARIRSRRR